MSRAEEITSEVRRLVLTCRAMEAQLQQSLPKKTHQEVVSKMQAIIDGLNAEVERVKADLQKTTGLNESISGLGKQISSQTETITSQAQTIIVHSQTVESQGKTIEALGEKLSQHTVPVLLYNQTLSRVEELEEKIRCMVDKVDYVTSQKKCEELSETLRSMIPREEYLTLQAQFSNFVPRASFDELQRTLSQYVPREQLAASETRVRELEKMLASYVPREQLAASEMRNRELEVRMLESYVPRELLAASVAKANELEAKLASHVPRSDYEELTARIASLTKEAAEALVQIPAESLVEIARQQQTKLEEVSQNFANSASETVSVQQQIIDPMRRTSSAIPEKSTPAVVATTVASKQQTVGQKSSSPGSVEFNKPEISEIQTQLSEIKGDVDSGEKTTTSSTHKFVDGSLGFVFRNTSFCAKSGLEFLQDLEKAPVEIVELHCRNGDFERWFKDVLSDESSATSLMSIRESDSEGEELKSKIVAVIAPRYRS
ncbi:MAG: hypothetical protein ACREBS_08940 [Nitrososphaerales archaeon]